MDLWDRALALRSENDYWRMNPPITSLPKLTWKHQAFLSLLKLEKVQIFKLFFAYWSSINRTRYKREWGRLNQHISCQVQFPDMPWVRRSKQSGINTRKAQSTLWDPHQVTARGKGEAQGYQEEIKVTMSKENRKKNSPHFTFFGSPTGSVIVMGLCRAGLLAWFSLSPPLAVSDVLSEAAAVTLAAATWA